MSDTQSSSDRRRAERLPITLPIEIGEGRGLTHDVSGLGVYFTTDIPFEVDSDIEFRLCVPDAVAVKCRGRVVRVVPERDNYGVAVTIDDYAIDEGPAGASRRAHIVIDQIEKHHQQS